MLSGTALAERETMQRKAREFCTQRFTTLPMADLRPLIMQVNRGFSHFLKKEEAERKKWTSWRRQDPRDGTPDDGYLPRDGSNGKDIKTSFHVRKDLMDILVNEKKTHADQKGSGVGAEFGGSEPRSKATPYALVHCSR